MFFNPGSPFSRRPAPELLRPDADLDFRRSAAYERAVHIKHKVNVAVKAHPRSTHGNPLRHVPGFGTATPYAKGRLAALVKPPTPSQQCFRKSMAQTYPLPNTGVPADPSESHRRSRRCSVDGEERPFQTSEMLLPRKSLYSMYNIARRPSLPGVPLPIPAPRKPRIVPPPGYCGVGISIPGERGFGRNGKFNNLTLPQLPTEHMYQALAGKALAAGTQIRFKLNRLCTVMQVVSPSVLDDAYYDENSLSTFFRLSQKTGFSKQRLAEIFSKWAEVTRQEDMLLGQFCTWMKNIGFQDSIAIEQLFYAFDEDGGGSISFAECTMGLSFILPRDIRLQRFEVTIEGCPEFLEIAYKFLDYHTNFDEHRGLLMKAGICKLLSSSLKMSARAASAMAAELIEFAGDKRAKFLHTLQKCPELWRFMRQLLQIQNQEQHTREFVVGKQRALRHFDNALNGRDEGEHPSMVSTEEKLDHVLPVYVDNTAVMKQLLKNSCIRHVKSRAPTPGGQVTLDRTNSQMGTFTN